MHRLASSAKRVVVKIGTSVLTRETGELHRARVRSLVREIAGLHDGGREVVVVTSGAISGGMGRLGIRKRPSELPLKLKQVCAAVGQSRLMRVYEDYFSRHGKTVAQILLTEEELVDRTMYRNLWTTLQALLEMGVIPIINENDAISVHELKHVVKNSPVRFGDNDRLSALVASRIGADLLILLSDVDGLYTADPTLNKDTRLIPLVKRVTRRIAGFGGGEGSMGRGGMRTKLEAARIATRAGVAVVIANGKRIGMLSSIASGRFRGTLFLPQRKGRET